MKNIFIQLARKMRIFIKYMQDRVLVNVNISQVNYNKILEGKRVLVTGSRSGIGYTIAKKYLEESARVVIAGRDIQELNNVSKKFDSNHLLVLE